MKIAFVGKGGSGKTTLSALFIQYLASLNSGPVLAVDADLNMHLGPLLGLEAQTQGLPLLSHPSSVEDIKKYLRGQNNRIKELAHFRKTTPPTKESNFVVLGNENDYILSKYAAKKGNVSLMVVGTYDTEEVGISCYHNNLSILENILTHLDDRKGVVVADMVAGVDAFANTLHAQFDLLVLVVEPTRRGIEVLNQYITLAEQAGVLDLLKAVGNKAKSEADTAFFQKHVPKDMFLGVFPESDYMRYIDQEGGALEISKLEESNQELLAKVYEQLKSAPVLYDKRLKQLFELHKRYVAQGFIVERFGDLTNQIDPQFSLEAHLKDND